ncbi:MAG: hypothetical protein JWO09_735 [Bacteroidetes bacterium]|nr:hypothetical protein [Bacteroidota bacterium]
MNQKLLLTGTFYFLSALSFAQDKPKPEKKNTFEIQAKGLGNSTWLFNKNISDIGDEQDYANGIGINYGLAFNAYFGNVGVGIEALMGNHQGNYAGTFEFKDPSGAVISKTDYKSYVNLKTIQVPLLFKLKSDNGGYLEVGPQYNIISSANYSYKSGGMSADTNVSSNYSSSYISAVIGFGFKIKFGDSPLSMNAGLRLQYSFTDVKGVDALGRRLDDPFYYKNYENTSAATGGIVLALVYRLGGN